MDPRQTAQFAELYFWLGFSQKDILSCLAWNHGVIISRRTLQRWLKKRNLYRRKGKSDLSDIALCIMEELGNSGQLHGYRWMHLKCLHEGFVVTEDTIRVLLQILDPEGVTIRRRRRLREKEIPKRRPRYDLAFGWL